MKTKSKNLFLLILTFIMAVSCIGIIGISASADTQAVTPKFEMLGAGVRLEEPTGIRFGARIDEARYNEVMAGEDTVFGAIILPKDILGDIEISSITDHVTALAGKTYLDSINNYSQGLAGKVEKDAEQNPTGYYTISYSMTEVKYGNLNREFFGLVYIRTSVDDGYTYEYASCEDGVNVKTVAEVAKSYYPNAIDDEVNILENFIYKAEYLENNPVTDNDYVTSETNASEYITAQKQAILDFKEIAQTTTANQFSINAAMDKYNALGDFAKTLVETEKAGVDTAKATLISDTINALSEQTSFVIGDYHKVYGLKASYTTLPAEKQNEVINYSELAEIENKIETYFGIEDVKVLYGATEEENGAIASTSYSGDSGASLSYEEESIYGPIIVVTNNTNTTRTFVKITSNFDVDYADYNLSFNILSSKDSNIAYINKNIAWVSYEVDKTNLGPEILVGVWSQYIFDGNELGKYNNARQIGVDLITKSNNIKMSAVLALKMSEIGQLNFKISELNSKDLMPEDYHLIYGLNNRYETMSESDKELFDNVTLQNVISRFNELYDVVVIHNGEESEATIRGDGLYYRLSMTYSSDGFYGATIKGTNTQSNEQVNRIHIAHNYDANLADYTVYFNLKVSQAAMMLDYNTNNSIGAVKKNVWTSLSVKYSDLEVKEATFKDAENNNVNKNALTIQTTLLSGSTIELSAIFAIREK